MEDDTVEDVFLQEGLCPTIAEHAAQCNALFRKYMIMPEIVPDPTIIDDQLARFTLWTTNMDVLGPINVSLDYRLRFSPTVVDIIHQLLDVICDTLISLKPVTEPPLPPKTSSRKRQRTSRYGDPEVTRDDDDDTSDSDSQADQAEANILKITDTVGGTVSRLFRLSNAVRKSAKDNRARKIEKYTEDRKANEAIAEIRLYTECYIRFRFPMAPDALRSAMVEANALRLRRLYYQLNHRRRIDLSMQQPEPAPPVAQLPKIKDTTPTVRFDPVVFAKPAMVDKEWRQAGTPVVPVTNATTARQTAVGAFYAKSTTDVPRAKSVLANSKLLFPPVPSTSECPYCGVIVEFKNKAKSVIWNNHVIGDLEPFICVFTSCLEARQHDTGPQTFESSKAWISHMQSAHGHVWECRAPSHDSIIFESESQFQEHSIREHDVPETHAGLLSRAARRPALVKMLECPFGDDFQPPESEEPNPVFASEALQSHVAAHVKEIALLTLQKLPSDGDEHSENLDSDQPLEDDGLGFTNLRGSMYSLLDDEELNFEDHPESPNGTMDHHEEEEISASTSRLNLEDKDDWGMTRLHHAVEDGDLNLVKSLITEGANLESKDNGGRTAMHYAAEKGLVECIRILIDSGADVRTTDSQGFSPFLWAVVAGQISVAIEMFPVVGSDANLTSADGKHALAWLIALHTESKELRFKDLMDCTANIPGFWNTQETLLGKAAASGLGEVLQLLIAFGMDVNHRDRDGWSAIHWAAEEGYLSFVNSLLDAGANIHAVSSYGTSPLHCAANSGNLGLVSSLLDRGADPLKATCHGWTALHHAAFMGHSNIVKLLLENDLVRSNALQQDNHGWSVLHLAVHSRNLATINILMRSAIPEPQALLDESSLTAEEWLDLKFSGHLYKATSNLALSKSRCCRAVTNLRLAVTTGNIYVVKVLLKSGYDVNGINSGTRTALYYAAKKGLLPIIDLLIQSGADPNILPIGRKSWEEFISDEAVLQRLRQAGYKGRNTDREVERQIRLALGGQYQSYARNRSVSFAPDEAISPMSWQSTSSVPRIPSPIPASRSPSFPDPPSSSNTPFSVTLMSSRSPSQETNDNKRKLGTFRSRANGLWQRLRR